MANKSVITYFAPKDKFLMVGKAIVSKFSADVIGIYCKIINLSGGMSLTISFISKKIQVSEKKVRKVIVLLEDEGYVVRTPLKDDHGSFIGWNYCVFADPVSKEKRSHAGRKLDLTETGLDRNRTSPKTDKSENGKENILSDIDISSNINENYLDKDKKPTYVGKKSVVSDSLFPEQKTDDDLYMEYMLENYPYIMKMDKPLTRHEAKKLKDVYGEDIVLEVFTAMNNHKRLLRDYRSAYLTANTWCTRRIQNTGNK